MTVLTFNDIYAARQRLEPVIARIPLLAAPWASCGHRSLLLKPENLQVTGSFAGETRKPTAAANRTGPLAAQCEGARAPLLTKAPEPAAALTPRERDIALLTS